MYKLGKYLYNMLHTTFMFNNKIRIIYYLYNQYKNNIFIFIYIYAFIYVILFDIN